MEVRTERRIFPIKMERESKKRKEEGRKEERKEGEISVCEL